MNVFLGSPAGPPCLQIQAEGRISNISLNSFSHQPNASGSSTVNDTPTCRNQKTRRKGGNRREKREVFFHFADTGGIRRALNLLREHISYSVSKTVQASTRYRRTRTAAYHRVPACAAADVLAYHRVLPRTFGY